MGPTMCSVSTEAYLQVLSWEPDWNTSVCVIVWMLNVCVLLICSNNYKSILGLTSCLHFQNLIQWLVKNISTLHLLYIVLNMLIIII